MLRTYALAPETISRIMRRTLLHFHLLVTGSFLSFALFLVLFSRPVRWQVAGPIVGVIALVYFFVLFFNYRSQLRLLYSFRYEIDVSTITWRQVGHEPLHISRADISAVREQKNGLWIETIDQDMTMHIPYGLARSGDEDFRETLRSWIGVEPLVIQKSSGIGQLLLIGVVGSLLVLLFANSLVVMLPLGLLVILLALYTERRLSRSQDSSAPMEVRMYNMAFSFLIFIIIMKSCFLGIALAIAM